MLTCVLNLSEGRDERVLDALARAAGSALLDLHTDLRHHRSVLTLGGVDVEQAARNVAEAAVTRIDLSRHVGVHPRLGALDVVPFVPFPPYLDPSQVSSVQGAPEPMTAGTTGAGTTGRAAVPSAAEPARPIWLAPLDEALAARESFIEFACRTLRLASYRYGPERSLPEVRRGAGKGLGPDCAPAVPRRAAGACCVGARGPLVAYNVVLAEPDLALARSVAAALRSSSVRVLAFALGTEVHVSFNLIEPHLVGPADAYDAVNRLAGIRRAELVGLVPEAVLAAIPVERWSELDLRADRTLEWRLAAASAPGRPGAPPTRAPARSR